jgi:hypothetical protein
MFEKVGTAYMVCTRLDSILIPISQQWEHLQDTTMMC